MHLHELARTLSLLLFMDAPNPYEPPQPVIEGDAITDRFPSIINFCVKNENAVVATNSEGETLFIFRRPMLLLRDLIAALGFVAILIVVSVPLISATLFFEGASSPTIIVVSIITAIAIWISILAFYSFAPRFEFAVFASDAPRVSLYSVRYHFFGFYRTLKAANRDSHEQAKVHLRGNNLEAVPHQDSFPTLHLTRLEDSGFSLSALTPQATPTDNPIPQPLGTAQFLGNELCFRSQIPESMPMDQKLLAISLLVLALIDPAKSQMFLR